MAGPEQAGKGGLAPLALRAHPPAYFHQDEGGAVRAASLLLRGAGLLAGLWVAVWSLPVLPDLIAALLVVGLGGLIALPWAWALAVKQGFDLGEWQAEGRLRPVLAGAFLRLVVTGLAGTMAAAHLLLRLVEAGPIQWALIAAIFPLTWGLMAWLAPCGRAEKVGLHARRMVHRFAIFVALVPLLFLSALVGWLLPLPVLAPFSPPDAAGPLVAEALAFTRMWAGLESFAMGHVAAFGNWGRGLALLVSVAGQAAVFGAVATLAIAVALPWREWSRTLGPASDRVPPSPVGRVGPVVAIVLAVALVAGAVGTGRWLGARAPEALPSARVMTLAEQIGDAFYRPGTQARIEAMRARAAEQDAALAVGLAQAMEVGFDAMEANVDTFLDSYYSLGAEYLRLINIFWLEAHLESQLRQALTEGGAMQAAQDMLDHAAQVAQARLEALRAAEADLLARNRIEEANPAFLRLEGGFDPLPELSGRFAKDLQTAQRRWAGAGGAGVMTAAIAARVTQRLAARGVLNVAARGLLRVAGLLVAVAVDYALIRWEEAQNREAFRAEIMAEIDALRQETLNSLNLEEGEGHLALTD